MDITNQFGNSRESKLSQLGSNRNFSFDFLSTSLHVTPKKNVIRKINEIFGFIITSSLPGTYNNDIVTACKLSTLHVIQYEAVKQDH